MVPEAGETVVHAKLWREDKRMGSILVTERMLFVGFADYNLGLNGKEAGVIVGKEKDGRYVLEVAQLKNCEFEF